MLWLDINTTIPAYSSWTFNHTKFDIGDIFTTNLILVGATYQDLLTFGSFYSKVKTVNIDPLV
jgi:hypothetical protein